MSNREEQLNQFYMGIEPECSIYDEVQPECESFNIEELIKEQEELWKDKDILPFGHNIIIIPKDENPYITKITKSGLINDGGGLFKNPESGEMDMLKNGICYAIVYNVGSDVKHIKPGDEIIYLGSRILPIPFKETGYCIVNEGAVLAIINKSDKLTNRYE